MLEKNKCMKCFKVLRPIKNDFPNRKFINNVNMKIKMNHISILLKQLIGLIIIVK